MASGRQASAIRVEARLFGNELYYVLGSCVGTPAAWRRIAGPPEVLQGQPRTTLPPDDKVKQHAQWRSFDSYDSR